MTVSSKEYLFVEGRTELLNMDLVNRLKDFGKQPLTVNTGEECNNRDARRVL